MVVLAICFFMTVGNELKKDATQNKQICIKHQPSLKNQRIRSGFACLGFFPQGTSPAGFFPSRKARFFPVRKTCDVCHFLCFFVSFYSVFYFTLFIQFLFVSSPAKKYAYSALSNDEPDLVNSTRSLSKKP